MAASVETTASHPWWDVTTRTYTRTDHLSSVDQLLTVDGQTLTFASMSVSQGQQQVYNLTVTGPHTFYVGDTQLLVHNVTPCPTDTWGNAATLADHYARHGADVGATSADDYADKASQFLTDGVQQGLPTKIDTDGTIRMYDPSTNTFGSYNADGTTKTLFSPDPAQHGLPTNQDYWNTQPGAAPIILGGGK